MNSVVGTKVEQMLKELRESKPRSLYSVIWGIFENDDVAIWMIRQCCRGVAGFAILEEFTTLFYDDRGMNGKGTILNLLRLALGDYYTTCVYKALCITTAGNNDRLAACRGKRMISRSEAFTPRT